MRLFPTYRQWLKWNLPTKISVVGSYIGIFSVLISFIMSFMNSITIDNSEVIYEEEIIVAAVINDREYYDYIKEGFENRFKIDENRYRYKLTFVPDYTYGKQLTGESSKRMEELIINDTEKKIDLFIGGNVGIVENYASELANLKDFLVENKEIEVFDSEAYKWIGLYQKLLAVVWNKNSILDTIKSLESAINYHSCRILIPDVGTSASHDLFLSLSRDSSEINFTKGFERYKNLIEIGYTNNTSINRTCELVAKFGVCIAITWPHDALKFLESNPNYKSCIGISILDDAIPTYSTITARNKTIKKGTKELIKYLLNDSTQIAHFEKSYRLPVKSEVFKQARDVLIQNGLLTHFEFSHNYLPVNYKMEKEFMEQIYNSYSKVNSLFIAPSEMSKLREFEGCYP